MLKKHWSSQKDYSLAIFSCTCSFICSSSWKKRERREQEASRFFHISYHKMPRATKTTERTARWNSWDNDKFWSLVARGYINIDNISPKFIKSIRTRHGWENFSAINFCQNYRRVANTLWLALDLNGAWVRQKGEFCRVFFFFWHIL